MKLTAAELACVRSQGLYLTEKCDQCGKPLNQALRYTITGRPEVFCSAACRELAFFADRREAKKHASPGKCVNCGAKLEGQKAWRPVLRRKMQEAGGQIEGATIYGKSPIIRDTGRTK